MVRDNMSIPPVSSTQEHLRELIARLVPHDSTEVEHLAEVHRWIGSTVDLYRSISHPVTPRQHLVSYFLPVDSPNRLVLLGDHIKSGLWLPSGGHVEPGEDPADTVRRECQEELQIDAQFHPALGPEPLLLTVTETTGRDPHRDVSLWYVLETSSHQVLTPDPREYLSVRWSPVSELRAADVTRFDPHMSRMLDKLEATVWRE